SKVSLQIIRGAILDILAIGVDDVYPDTDEIMTRHALTAKELNESVNERIGDNVKKSNLYFHLQKLEEVGLVKEIDKIPTGKRYIHYYGRTAKAYLVPGSSEKNEKYQELLLVKFPQLIQKIQPNASEKEIGEVVEAVNEIFLGKYPNTVLGQWLEAYQKHIIDLDIDIRRFIDLVIMISKYDVNTIHNIQKFVKLLKFDNLLD
ncbi:MAG: winged helix-turn-helix domain-containing protein, partial [Candidatus Kariarchaeaceae archaeon]